METIYRSRYELLKSIKGKYDPRMCSTKFCRSSDGVGEAVVAKSELSSNSVIHASISMSLELSWLRITTVPSTPETESRIKTPYKRPGNAKNAAQTIIYKGNLDQ